MKTKTHTRAVSHGARDRDRKSKIVSSASGSLPNPKSKRASIIIVVLVTMAFAALALTIFMDKAANDLTVEIRENDAMHMRLEAYSAMETTLAILEDYRAALGQLHSPAEGWGMPDLLSYWGYEPLNPEYTITLEFEDESGKISLPNVNATILTTLFKYWQFDDATSEKLTDSILGWMKSDYIPASAGAPKPEDYDTGDLPFAPPGRSLRSFDELASIDFARDIFFDENRRPTEFYDRFVKTFSLYDYKSPNINAAPADILGALGSLDPAVDQKLADFLATTPANRSAAAPAAGGGYFISKDEVNQLLGAGTPAAQLGVTISALRIIVTVRGGQSSYRLSTLVSMPGSNGAKIPADWSKQPAKPVTTAADNTQKPASTPATLPGNPGASRTSSSAATTQQKPLNYPYTVLEIRENDLVPPPAPLITGDAHSTETGG